MPDTGLATLYQLHLLDASLHEMKARASALDVGQEETAKFKLRASETEEVRTYAKNLKQEEADLEVKVKTWADKKAAWNKKLYDGSVVSNREVESIQAEMLSLTQKIEEAEARAMEILELLPAATAESKKAEVELIKLKKIVEQKKIDAAEELKALQARYAERQKFREPMAAKVPKPLLAQYESVRKHVGTPAMTLIRDDGYCASCGLPIPTKTQERVRQDYVTACESCHRILFMPLGGI